MKLIGGLGNQLFCYFAGYDLATRTSSGLELDVTDIRSGISAHAVSIESLSLPGNFTTSGSSRFFSKLKLRDVLVRISRKFDVPILLSKKVLISKEIGFDKNIMGVIPGSSLFGYFQTYRHFFLYKHEFQDVCLKNPSSWFKENLQRMRLEKAVAVHVRRGDYSGLADTYGLLSADYYKQAMNIILEFVPNSIFWVFSDDLDLAELLLKNVLPSNTFWVRPPADHDAAETMLLMANASGNIIANSTFSWWGAALNSNGGPVVAPSQWFKSMPDPIDLYHPDWIKAESSWVK